jgi:DNA-binding NarL/FixJ family response regulator
MGCELSGWVNTKFRPSIFEIFLAVKIDCGARLAVTVLHQNAEGKRGAILQVPDEAGVRFAARQDGGDKIMNKVRILIADDHEVVREGARMVLETVPDWEIYGTANNGSEAVEQAKKLKPDILLLDMGMPEMNGLGVAREIKRILPQTEILIFTTSESESLANDDFEAGVKSHILNVDAPQHLVGAVKALCQQKTYFTGKMSETPFTPPLEQPDQKKNDPEVARLTPREQQIVRLLAEGKTNKQVAEQLDLSVRTVETHRANVLRKKGIESLAGLVRYAVRNGIIEA